MTSWILASVTIMASLLPAFAVAKPFRHQAQARSPSDPAVSDSIARFIGAFNQHDAQAVAMVFAEGADFTSVRGISAHGRKEIESFYVGVFSGRLKSARRTASVTRIRPLAPNIASVDATWEITGATSDDGATIPLRRGILTVILTKENDVWLIAVYHELEWTAT